MERQSQRVKMSGRLEIFWYRENTHLESVIKVWGERHYAETSMPARTRGVGRGKEEGTRRKHKVRWRERGAGGNA